VKETLLDGDHLRARLKAIIEAESKNAVAVDVEDLKRQREKLKKRTELIVATLDEETLADAQVELEKLKAERRSLDEQIAAAARTTLPTMDANAIADRLMEKTNIFFGEVSSLPTHLIRDWLALVVTRVVVDMETKAIKIDVAMPSEMLKSAFSGEKAMRLATTSASSGGYGTHRPLDFLTLIHCDWIKSSNRICYDCRRRFAA
jgi:hypothetical protein